MIIQYSHEYLMRLDIANLPSNILFFKDSLGWLRTVTNYLSPFYFINLGIEAIFINSLKGYLISSLASLFYSILFLSISVLILKKKGVRKPGGE
jgi:hypothetical protein